MLNLYRLCDNEISEIRYEKSNISFNKIVRISLVLLNDQNPRLGLAFPRYSVEIGCSLGIKNIKIRNIKRA